MKFSLYKAGFDIPIVILLLVSILAISCIPIINQPIKISSLSTSYLYIYPQGTVELKCTATDTLSNNLNFKWTCTDGSITGDGSTVLWKAPNKYGDFHIMVVVEDDKGNSSQSNITIGVIYDANNAGCTTCGYR